MRNPHFYIHFLIALGFSFLIAGCDTFNQLDERAQLMINTKEHLIRGVDFDQSLKVVKHHEHGILTKEFEDYLNFSIELDSLYPEEKIEVEYFFNNRDQLDLIIVFYKLQNKADIEPLVLDVKQYFERKFGPANEDEIGWYNWDFKSKTGLPGTIEINLVGETEEGYLGVEIEMLKYYEFEKAS